MLKSLPYFGLNPEVSVSQPSASADERRSYARSMSSDVRAIRIWTHRLSHAKLRKTANRCGKDHVGRDIFQTAPCALRSWRALRETNDLNTFYVINAGRNRSKSARQLDRKAADHARILPFNAQRACRGVQSEKQPRACRFL